MTLEKVHLRAGGKPVSKSQYRNLPESYCFLLLGNEEPVSLLNENLLFQQIRSSIEALFILYAFLST
jgi:hypothetical protein